MKKSFNTVIEEIQNRDNPLTYDDIKAIIEEAGHIATDDMIEACNPDSPFAVAAWIREQE
jgi:hypothetical protein